MIVVGREELVRIDTVFYAARCILAQERPPCKSTYNAGRACMSADVATLTRLINNEVIEAMGVPTRSWAGERLQPLLARATRRFSEIFASADRIIAERGLAVGARWLLLNLVKDFRARGVENIPMDGPLVIASNHPGTVDSITLVTAAGREDLKIIASDVPFLKSLSHVGEHLIFLPRRGVQARMLVVREAV